MLAASCCHLHHWRIVSGFPRVEQPYTDVFQENKDWKNVEPMPYPNRFLKYCKLLIRVDLGYMRSWSTAAKALVRKLGFALTKACEIRRHLIHGS